MFSKYVILSNKRLKEVKGNVYIFQRHYFMKLMWRDHIKDFIFGLIDGENEDGKE